MIQELKTFKCICDKCKAEEILHTYRYNGYDGHYNPRDLPPGWGRKEDHGYGMTNYSKTLELCSECLKDWK